MALNIADFELFWGDEFTEMKLANSPDPNANWFTQQSWGGSFSNAAFQPAGSDVFALSNKGGESCLEIKLLRDSPGGPLRGGIISNLFIDGSSRANQTSREGYYEARMWLPDPHPGIWPAFWSIGKNRLTEAGRDQVPELDVLEHYGNAMPDRYTTAIHLWDWNGAVLEGHASIFSRMVPGQGVMNTGFHTYGIEIGADGSETYFFDREAYLFVGGKGSNAGAIGYNYNQMVSTPLGWMMNMAAGAGWPIHNDLGTPAMPASLFIDYFRIYRRIAGQAGCVAGIGGEPPPPPPPPPPSGSVPTVSIGDRTIAESGGIAMFTVTLSAAATAPVVVEYETNDGTAIGGQDYGGAMGEVVFAPGETSKTIGIDIFNDAVVEDAEAFTVVLTSARLDLTMTDDTGVGTITDDDAPTPPPGEIVGTEGDETIVGTAGPDTIFGLGGRDTIAGRAGDDVIIGGAGIDTLFGEGGIDQFKYGPDARGYTDVIRDWQPGEKIDLVALRGTEPFTFIGTAPFSGIRQVRLAPSSGLYTIVEVNVDGSLTADLTISLKNNPVLTESDFVL